MEGLAPEKSSHSDQRTRPCGDKPELCTILSA
jgi:hypothetical protein